MTRPATSAGGDGAVGGVERHAQRRHQQRAHLARRRGGRVDPVDHAEAGIRHVVVDVDDGQPAEQLGVTLEHGTHARQVAAVADDDQVVIVIWIGVLAEALDLRHEGIHRRHRIAAQRRRAAAQLLHRQGHRQRRAQRVRLRVLVADAEDVARSLGCARRPRPARWRRRAAVSEVSVAVVIWRSAHLTVRRLRAPGVGSVSRRSAIAHSRPLSRSSRMRSSRVPRSAVVSSLRCSSGMRLRRSLPNRWRTKGIARPSARSVCLRSCSEPMTDTHTLAWRRSGATSTSVTVTKPTRGSSTSRAMTALISSRSSSSRRAVRSSCLGHQLNSLPPQAACGRLLRAPRPSRSVAAPRTYACAAMRDTVCWLKHSMMSPSSNSLKLTSPMPHSKPAATSRTSSRKRRSDSMRSLVRTLPPR